MKTAQQKNYKKIVLTASFIAISSIFLSIKSVVSAQNANNPFIPTQNTNIESKPALLDTTNANNTIAKPVLLDATNATKTIAQDQISLTAIPPRLGDDNSILIAPGEKTQIQVRLRNLSEQPISTLTSARDFILDIDGETPISIDNSNSNRWSLASWLTITPTEHKIAPKDTVGINVLIEVPKDALPGGHYAMIIHEPGENTTNTDSSSSANNGSGASIDQRVGTLLYVVVKGPINEEAYVRDFNFPKFIEYGPVEFGYTVENNSDIHITPQMSVEIYNIFNQKVETIAITSKNIFPLTSRDFNSQWNRVWGWGFYKAKLTMSYGSAGSIVVANTNFWLLPLKLILAISALLMIVVFMLYSIKRHLNHRKKQAEEKIKALESQIQEMQTSTDL